METGEEDAALRNLLDPYYDKDRTKAECPNPRKEYWISFTNSSLNGTGWDAAARSQAALGGSATNVHGSVRASLRGPERPHALRVLGVFAGQRHGTVVSQVYGTRSSGATASGRSNASLRRMGLARHSRPVWDRDGGCLCNVFG